MSAKLITLSKLKKVLQAERQKGRKIVFTNGCFDILHVGHIRYLKEAKALGNILVVGLNSDGSVRLLKGPGRPVNFSKERAEVLAALECVDYVVVFSQKTPQCLIQSLKPDFLVKGGDWDKKAIVGSDFVESYGGKVCSLSLVPGRSTTRILKKIREKCEIKKGKK